MRARARAADLQGLQMLLWGVSVLGLRPDGALLELLLVRIEAGLRASGRRVLQHQLLVGASQGALAALLAEPWLAEDADDDGGGP